MMRTTKIAIWGYFSDFGKIYSLGGTILAKGELGRGVNCDSNTSSIILKKNTSSGFVSSMFLILYGIFRIFSENFRELDEHIGFIFSSFSMGSILTFVMIILGTFFLLKINLNEKNR